MARKQTNTVDYFPHEATPGKTLFILESRWGNDGYAFWFKLLSLLCLAEEHFLSCSKTQTWEYLLARTHVTGITGSEIMAMLSKLGNIDSELWDNHKIVWCQHLVDNLRDVYCRRGRPAPTKPLPNNLPQESPSDVISESEIQQGAITGDGNHQSKVKYSKVNNTKTTEHPLFQTFWQAYPKKKSKGQAEKAFAKINPDEQLLATMLATIERAKKSVDWSKEDGKYIPYPATWLNAKGWEDVIETVLGGKPWNPRG